MNIQQLDKLRSKLDRPALKLLKDLSSGIGVEVGTQYGVNARDILERFDITVLYLIDPYAPYPSASGNGMSVTQKEADEIKNIAHEYLKDFTNVVWLEMTSKDASKYVPKNLDFVYIDGDHRYETTKQDIEIYYPKVREGGFISGHDFVEGRAPGVVKAVSSYFKTDFQSAVWDWWHIK